MAVLVNFKICDNAKECGGIEVCPTNALSWNEEKETIEIDNNKCISCGLCEKECPIGAIAVAKTDEEYNKTKKEIDEDKRTAKDLFVDRYGAAPISGFFILKNEFDIKIRYKKLVLVELYDEDLRCLLKSIPIKSITDNIAEDVMFYKGEKNSELTTRYNISEYPCLLIFRSGKFLGKIEGYYDIDQKEQFENKVRQIIRS